MFTSLLAFVVAPPSLAQQVSDPDDLVGAWSGILEVQGMELTLVFHVAMSESGMLNATMDSPDQGVTGIEVSEATVREDSVVFRVPSIAGTFSGTFNESRDVIDGQWRQMGQDYPLALRLAPDGATAKLDRPQHPEEPYPYHTEEVIIEGTAGDMRLAGTLSLPEGDGPHPGVVLIPGSGAHTRDLDIMGHKPFLVLAHHLTRQGIAVLRYDERGTGESTGNHAEATSAVLAQDASDVLAFLKTHETIDRDNVGYIGLSEGGMLAPMAHVEHEPASFMVLLAAPSVPGADIIREQTIAILEAQGTTGEDLDAMRALNEDLLTALLSGSDSTTIAQTMSERLGEEEGLSEEMIQSQVQVQTSTWYRYFLSYDPATHLSQIDVPVLALYGEKDLQVLPSQNEPLARELLEASPSPDVTVTTLEGLNHLFQPAESGAPIEYRQISTTMDPEAMNAISDWILSQSSR